MSTDSSDKNLYSEPDTVRFIPEQVADADQFQHQPIAEVIARALVKHPHLRTIGLLGPWGSGKSTTVNFVRSEVETLTHEPCLVFTYDAWLYQSDAPRPAFIDALFEFLVKHERLKRADWNDHVAMLTGHLQVTYSSERPFTSATSRVMLVAALGAPLALILSDRHALITGGWAFWTEGRLAIAAVALTVLPAIVWVLSAVGKLLQRLWKRVFTTPTPTTNQNEAIGQGGRAAGRTVTLDARFAPTPTNESWEWILSRKPQAAEQRKVGKATPSTADFQSAFQSMVKAALKAKPGRLVIAVDNLDRLPVNEAVALWAVIRSFFLGGSSDLDHALNRLTILLPMDADYVAQIQGSAANGSPDRADSAQGLMEKTFDLTLRLPRPAFIDWQGYFRKQLAFAFYREPDDADIRNVGTVLNDAWRPKGDTITPRMVNAMVNRIVAMWLRWESSRIDLLVVASYAIRQNDIDGNLFGYLSLPNILSSIAPDTWQQWFAAMHYGIPPDDAIGLLLNGRIADAISEHDEDDFKILSGYSAFPELLRALVDGYGPSSEDTQILKTADLLAKAPLRGLIEQKHMDTMLARTFLHAKETGHFTEEHVGGIKALLAARVAGVAPSDLINRFVQSAAEAITNGYPSPRVLTHFFDVVEPAQDVSGKQLPLVVSAKSTVFFEVAEIAWDFPKWLTLLHTDDDPLIMAALAKRLDQPVGGADALINVFHSAVKAPWMPVVDVLTEGLYGRKAVPAATIGLGLGMLRKTESSVARLLGEGAVSQVRSAIGAAVNAEDFLAIGRLVTLALLHDDASVPAYSWPNVPTIDSVIDEVVYCLPRFGTKAEASIARLNDVALRVPQLTGLLAHVFAAVGRGEGAKELDVLVPHLASYFQHAKRDDLLALINAMLVSPTFWAALDAWSSDDAWMVLGIIHDERLVPSEDAQVATAHRLRTVTSHRWGELIYQGGSAYDALIGRTADGIDLPELVSALGTLISQFPQRQDLLGRWSMAARRLMPADQAEVFGRLAATLLQPDYSGVAGMAVIYAPELSQSAAFQSQPDVALRHVLPGLLTSSAAPDDIANAARHLIPIVQRASLETRAKLREELRSSASVPHLQNVSTIIALLWEEAISAPS